MRRPDGVYWDKFWNPFIGCTKIGPGCDNCWPDNYKKRFAASGILLPGTETHVVRPFKNWEKIIEAPARWKKPQVIAVCFLGDLFHSNVSRDVPARMFDIMCHNPRHTYLVLTKRPGRMARFVERYFRNRKLNAWLFLNIWYGVSAENQQMFNIRMGPIHTLDVPNKFVSLEPLLGPIDVFASLQANIRQVIIGAESGPKKKRRMCNPKWIYDIVTQCHYADVPVFVKQIHNIDKNGLPDISKDMSGWSLGISERKLAWEK